MTKKFAEILPKHLRGLLYTRKYDNFKRILTVNDYILNIADTLKAKSKFDLNSK